MELNENSHLDCMMSSVLIVFSQCKGRYSFHIYEPRDLKSEDRRHNIYR